MVKGVWLSFIIQLAPGMFLPKRKVFLVCGTWALEYLVAQKVTHIVLALNMDSSSFACHHTWEAGLSQMGTKTDMSVLG